MLDPVFSGVGKVLAYSSAKVGRDLRRSVAGSAEEESVRFLPMKASLDAWFAALRLLILGETFVPAELLARRDAVAAEAEPPRQMDRATEDTPQAPLPNLTTREVEVLGLLSRGMPNKTIADKLGLSEHTVKLHVHHVFGKLKVRNRVSATNWYLLHGDALERARGR
ncbi:response regulator transcription factor [Aliiroseovarius sp. Z3]|nr:response regulator transcription factor [Aliiroseovarius sp. Z3]